MLLDGIFQKKHTQAMKWARYMDNTTPLFSQSGRDIYTSDVVQMCIDCIASECSKLQPKHIRRDRDGKMINLPGDNINRLFKYRPNPLMTTREFIEKTIWTLYLDYNSFIYPAYDVITDSRGMKSRVYKAFWPLSPTRTEWLTDATGALFVKFTFGNDTDVILPYEDVIHLRKKYSVNDFMGGGKSGKPENAALAKTLEINDTLLTGTGKAIQSSLGVRGILKLNTTLEDEKQAKAREAMEQKIIESNSGIITGDFKGDYQPITLDPKIIEKSTLEFIENKILRWYGVSVPIINGTYDDNEYQSFYNKTLEPIIVGQGQAYSSVLFSQNEQNYNHEIIFYQHRLELMDVKNKLAILDGLGNRGAMTNNELLALFGIEPYEGGDVRMASLNYIDATYMNLYQLGKAKQNIEGGKIEDGK